MIRITIVVYRLFTPCTIASKEKRCYCCLIYKEKIRNKQVKYLIQNLYVVKALPRPEIRQSDGRL